MGNNFVVVMKDPATGIEKNLTMPSPRRPTENSCRRFKNIGMQNIFVAEKKRKRKKKQEKIDPPSLELLPDNEKEWMEFLVKNLEVDKNEK